ncbi:MAG: hypothetical protein GF350_16325 [Chitinivibrionales bacterium]|nr:hypothetical protein [Chitinivibrionales bacterium]
MTAHVFFVHRQVFFLADFCELEKARRISNIAWRVAWIIGEIKGTAVVNAAVVRNMKTGEQGVTQWAGYRYIRSGVVWQLIGS